MTDIKSIILPTTDMVSDWFKATSRMTVADYDFGEVINMVFTCCSVTDDYEFINRLEKTITLLTSGRELDDKVIFSKAFTALCNGVRFLLKSANLYADYLTVKYKTQIVDDWVVEPSGDYWEKINRRVILY